MINSEKPMFWRESRAALKAGVMGQWHTMPKWQKEWIIATIEQEQEINNRFGGG
jgi:hypothetical protein